jgi:hypothetical protein
MRSEVGSRARAGRARLPPPEAGAAARGDSQVRFELSTYSLAAGLECVVPWRIPEFYNKFQASGPATSPPRPAP